MYFYHIFFYYFIYFYCTFWGKWWGRNRERYIQSVFSFLLNFVSEIAPVLINILFLSFSSVGAQYLYFSFFSALLDLSYFHYFNLSTIKQNLCIKTLLVYFRSRTILFVWPVCLPVISAEHVFAMIVHSPVLTLYTYGLKMFKNDCSPTNSEIYGFFESL